MGTGCSRSKSNSRVHEETGLSASTVTDNDELSAKFGHGKCKKGFRVGGRNRVCLSIEVWTEKESECRRPCKTCGRHETVVDRLMRGCDDGMGGGTQRRENKEVS